MTGGRTALTSRLAASVGILVALLAVTAVACVVPAPDPPPSSTTTVSSSTTTSTTPTSDQLASVHASCVVDPDVPGRRVLTFTVTNLSEWPMTNAAIVQYTRTSYRIADLPDVPVGPGTQSTVTTEDTNNSILWADLRFTLGPGSPPISPTFTATSYPAGYNWWYVYAPFTCT